MTHLPHQKLSIIAGVALALCACSAAPGPTSAAPPAPKAAAVTHNWVSRDGQEYAYVAVISDDDRKAGRVAAPVTMFRYLGSENGLYTVATTDGRTATLASCTNPCSVVRLEYRTFYGRRIDHVQFTTDSLVGAALEDAFDGQLEVYTHTATPPPRPQGSGRAAQDFRY